MLPQQQDGIISAFPALMTMAEACTLVRRLYRPLEKQTSLG